MSEFGEELKRRHQAGREKAIAEARAAEQTSIEMEQVRTAWLQAITKWGQEALNAGLSLKLNRLSDGVELRTEGLRNAKVLRLQVEGRTGALVVNRVIGGSGRPVGTIQPGEEDPEEAVKRVIGDFVEWLGEESG